MFSLFGVAIAGNIFISIISLIISGVCLFCTIALNRKWLDGQLNKIFHPIHAIKESKKAKRAMLCDIKRLMDECDNKMSLSELNKLVDEGYSHVFVKQYNNDELEVEVIKDSNRGREIIDILGSAGEVVFER
ncbi:MAG: hypothetical protein II870_01345 [Synergistaceae bacterium]|nr:hypothetical protein [Synergistaceae bacterium]MBQ6908965.1 hypothetical protein [Synergistaceae bacterium]MBR0097039.1 hypothetical protein [Synergistaceae bacterium]